MTILNMVGGGKSGPKIPLNDISNLYAFAGNGEATIRWTDVGDLSVNGVLASSWEATKLVRKVGSAPSDSSDGTLLTISTTQDEYSVNGYPDTGLTNGTTYYYKAFSVADNGSESDSNTAFVTPDTGWHPGMNTYVYIKGDGSITDWSGKVWTTRNINFVTDSGLGLTYIDFPGISANGFYTNDGHIPCPYTYCVWIYRNSYGGSAGPRLLHNTHSADNYIWITMDNNTGVISVSPSSSSVVIPTNTWLLLTVTLDSTGTGNIYINGNLSDTLTSLTTTSSTSGMVVGYKMSNYNDYFSGRMSELIIENKVRTAGEISDYFSDTKANYGIS